MKKRQKKEQNFKDVKGILIYLQHFSELSELGELITSTKETSFTPYIDGFIDKTGRAKGYNKWTLLKLLALQLYVPLYTKIISKRYAEWNFIDLFSGSGVGTLEDTDIILPGSPIIGLSFASVPFTKAFFIDLSHYKITRLRKRISLLKELSKNNNYRKIILSDLSNVEIIARSQDANEAVYKIFDELEHHRKELLNQYNRGLHNLIFIDPYGMEFHYESLIRIISSKIRNDIFILFNSYGAGLQAYDHIHYGKSATALYNHLGEDWLEYVKKRLKDMDLSLEKATRTKLSVILSEYYEKLVGANGRYVTVRISLPLELRGQQFDLIFAAHKTGGGNKFVKAIDYIKRLLEKTEYRLIDTLKEAIINAKKGKKELPGLLRFMIRQPEKLLEKYSLSKRYGIESSSSIKMGTLDKWFKK